ncbi:hypothetical protein RMATCC62417_18158 [Rhizopus microsporus]|nr:hypothetical protein RMATCC62417_18158 [Rhizopus microsporus]
MNNNNTEQPVKIRKKPGRKPNPASPALRKAQNRAAQRAFRERKERHMRELEVSIKQIREQRDKLLSENEQLKADSEILKSENWYLKGIVLSLQLVCFQHNLVIPQHSPYINEQALSVLAQSIPEPIATYVNINANNKAPTPSKFFGYRHTMRQRDRHLSYGSTVISKEGTHSAPEHPLHPSSVPCNSKPEPITHENTKSSTPNMYEDLVHPLQSMSSNNTINIPPLSPPTDYQQPHEDNKSVPPKPVMLRNEPVTSNLAAIQALRLRLRLQSACISMDSVPVAVQPTLLQLTIPHDPRIDLIPTPHMRDRMILFRDQFDLDDCFRCLLSGSVFHGGDPAVAANWQLPAEFFEKYWFLTIDYDLRRTTNRWRRLQGLNDIDFEQRQRQLHQQLEEKKNIEQQPLLEQVPNLNYVDISALLGIEFQKIAAKEQQQQLLRRQQQQQASYASSLSSDCSTSSQNHHSPHSSHEQDDTMSVFEPIRLTEGDSLSYFRQKKKHQEKHKTFIQSIEHEMNQTWEPMLTDSLTDNYDTMMDTILDTEHLS